MKATWEIALDVLKRKVGTELEWAVEDLEYELSIRPNVVWCEECHHTPRGEGNATNLDGTVAMYWCNQHDEWKRPHEFCSDGLSRLLATQEEAELFDHDPKDELADELYHAYKGGGLL